MAKAAKRTIAKKVVKKAATKKPVGREAPRKASAKKSRARRGALEASAEQRHHMIAEAAYYRAEGRGFVTGYETEDWLAAEAFVDSLLASKED